MFVQHYLNNMFGTEQDFLDNPMVTQQLRQISRTENPEKIGTDPQTVRELSRFASYLGGNSPLEQK